MPNAKPPRLTGCSVLPPHEPGPAIQNMPPEMAKKPKNTAQRFGTINEFVDCSLADLSRAEALTWVVLWRDTKNGTARTSSADIARRIGVDRRTVTNAIAGLRERGLLSLVHRGGMNQGVSVHRVCPLSKPP